jgi:Family of unknown function (DUF6152)
MFSVFGCSVLRCSLPHSHREDSLKYKIFAILIVFATLFAAGPLWAHHGLSAIFDTSKKLTLTGTLTEVDWQNPHIVVSMESKKDDGSVEMWKLESNPPAWFKRLGIARNDFAKSIGKVITVEGLRAKDGSLYGYLQKVTFSEGNSLELVDQNQPH